jgi:hypothetical protein
MEKDNKVLLYFFVTRLAYLAHIYQIIYFLLFLLGKTTGLIIY